MLLGETNDLPPALAGLSTTGLLRHEQPLTIERWIDAALRADLVMASKDRYRTLSLTALGRQVMLGRAEAPHLMPPARPEMLSSWRSFRTHRRSLRFSDEW